MATVEPRAKAARGPAVPLRAMAGRLWALVWPLATIAPALAERALVLERGIGEASTDHCPIVKQPFAVAGPRRQTLPLRSSADVPSMLTGMLL